MSSWTENVCLMLIRRRRPKTENGPYDYEVFLRRNRDRVNEFITGQQEEWSQLRPTHLCLPRMNASAAANVPEDHQKESLTAEIERKLRHVPMMIRQQPPGSSLQNRILSFRDAAFGCIRQELGGETFGVQLFEWWNWLTPTTVGGSARFDTMYYLAILGDSSPNGPERGLWLTLDRFHKQYYRQEGILVPPADLYELQCLARFSRLADLRQCLRGESYRSVAIQRWIPSVQLYRNGSISYLPGDYMYPAGVELMPAHPPRDNAAITMESMRRKYERMARNRIEHRGLRCRIVANLADQHYHVPVAADHVTFEAKL